MDKKHYPVLGAPCSGKGAIKNALKKKLGSDIHAFGPGHILRERFSIDPQFRREHEEKVSSGELLPCHIAINLVEKAYMQGLKTDAKSFYWDGCLRTGRQARYFLDREVITPENTTVFVLTASNCTVKRRHQHRSSTSTGGERNDDKSFPRRLELFYEHLPAILFILGTRGIRVHHVNADLELDELTTGIVEHVSELENSDGSHRPSFPEHLEITPKMRHETSLLRRAQFGRVAGYSEDGSPISLPEMSMA